MKGTVTFENKPDINRIYSVMPLILSDKYGVDIKITPKRKEKEECISQISHAES